jgi:HK97 family phage major capsid protein
MPSDTTAGDDGYSERPFGGRPFGGRPYGGRPYGGRPYGGRPFGGRPEDDRPFGGRPYGGRPFGGRPYGGRPYGGRPYGGRPFGGRPFGGRHFGGRQGEDEGRPVLDPDEWSADVAELVCQRSAVIRLGATVVSDEYELRAPTIDSTPTPVAPDYVKEGGEKPILGRRELTLRPRDHELAAKVVLPDRVPRDIAADPLLALVVKEDLAEALALRADRAFLSGAGPGLVGVASLVQGVGAQTDIVTTGRALLRKIRTVDPLVNPTFRAPGWVLHPATLDVLVQEPAGPSDTTVDLFSGLLCLDGADGGEFLGYPFVVSAAAFDGGSRRMYFSADWRQAWIGVDGVLVDVDFSADVHFQTDETVIRATMAHDFDLARPEAFTWAEEDFKYQTSARKKARSSG